MIHRHRLIAFLATLGAIVTLTLFAVVAVLWTDNAADTDSVARLVGALGFISSAVTGLIGLIGTFRPSQNGKEPDA